MKKSILFVLGVALLTSCNADKTNERASELLPEDGVDHHPSKYAAKAMLAKVLLAQVRPRR